MENNKKVIHSSYWVIIFTGYNILSKLILLFILSRILSPYEFGVVAALQIIISVAEIFWQLGVGPAIVQKNSLNLDDIKSAFFLSGLLGIIIFLCIIVTSKTTSVIFNIPDHMMIIAFSFTFLIKGFSIVSEALLQRNLQFKFTSIVNIIAITIGGFTAFVLAIKGYGAWSLIVSQIIQNLIISLAIILKSPISFKAKVKYSNLQSLLSFGISFTISRFFNTLALQGDNFIVNKFLGITLLGYYNRSYQLLMVPTMLMGSVIDKVLFPYFSKMQNNREGLKKLYINLILITALITIPITFLSIILAEEIVMISLGENWNEVVLTFQILIVSLFFRIAYKICDTIIYSLGEVKHRIWTQIVYATSIIVGAMILYRWGIVGVATSTTFSIIINYFILNYLVLKFTSIKLSELLLAMLNVLLYLGSTIIITIIAYFIFKINQNTPILIVVETLLLFTVTLCSLYLIIFKNILPYDLVNIINKVMKSLRNKIKYIIPKF